MREVYFHRDNRWYVLSVTHTGEVSVEELESDFAPPPNSRIVDAPKRVDTQTQSIKSQRRKPDYAVYAVALGLIALGIVLFTISVI